MTVILWPRKSIAHGCHATDTPCLEIRRQMVSKQVRGKFRGYPVNLRGDLGGRLCEDGGVLSTQIGRKRTELVEARLEKGLWCMRLGGLWHGEHDTNTSQLGTLQTESGQDQVYDWRQCNISGSAGMTAYYHTQPCYPDRSPFLRLAGLLPVAKLTPRCR